MKTNHCIKCFILLILIVQPIFTSCVSKKKINYFQNNQPGDTLVAIENNKNYTPIFESDDFLSIEITALDLESVKPFLLDVTSGGNQATSYSNGIPAKSGYLIDANGNIDFPILGKVHLAGLNRMDATELIKTRLGEYISNPVVNIRIQNFKITILGDVRSPGSFNIPNERITLPEAIGIAGDLNMTGVRKNILVIRDVNGTRTEYRVDLTTKDVFNSPVYYLAQNDVIYIEPNRAKRNSSLVSSTSGIFISIASLLITTVTLITRQ